MQAARLRLAQEIAGVNAKREEILAGLQELADKCERRVALCDRLLTALRTILEPWVEKHMPANPRAEKAARKYLRLLELRQDAARASARARQAIAENADEKPLVGQADAEVAKGNVRAHSRHLASGKVVQVAAHTDKRTKQPEAQEPYAPTDFSPAAIQDRREREYNRVQALITEAIAPVKPAPGVEWQDQVREAIALWWMALQASPTKAMGAVWNNGSNKSGRDKYLMRRFGIDEAAAHAINNRVTEMAPVGREWYRGGEGPEPTQDTYPEAWGYVQRLRAIAAENGAEWK